MFEGTFFWFVEINTHTSEPIKHIVSIEYFRERKLPVMNRASITNIELQYFKLTDQEEVEEKWLNQKNHKKEIFVHI